MVTIVIKANDPFIGREPASWDGTRCIKAIWSPIGQVVSFKRPFHPATPFTLTARLTEDGFAGLLPDLGFEKVVVSHTISIPLDPKLARSR